MSEVYVLVETKKSMARKIAGYLVAALTAITALLTFIGFAVLFPIAIMLGLGAYFLLAKGYKEYEYSYFDGDVRFAKIMNKSRRKALRGCSIEDVLQIAPAGDRSVYKYENDNSVKVKDFTSKQDGVPYYDMIIKTEEGIILYKVELDDKYLDAVCTKHASKVIRRQA